jgi:hypothetical protein
VTASTELEITVEALTSVEEDAVGHPMTKNQATDLLNRLERLENAT